MTGIVEILGRHDEREIVDVFCDAFAAYPVMQFVLGPGGHTPDRLAKLIGLFVARRIRLGGPLFGVRDREGTLAGVATVTPPVETEGPPDLLAERDRVFGEIGDDCRARHDAYAAAAKTVTVAAPHHHLNMLGIRTKHQGQGLSRPLVEAVSALARHHPTSTGVDLTTELPANVQLYEHFGFKVVGQARVADSFDTWGMFLSTRD